MAISTSDARVLVFSCHVADYCFRAGGTMLNYVREGGVVKTVVVTRTVRGESGTLWSEHPGITADRVAEVRRKEAEDAAQILGVEIDFLEWEDNPLIIDEDRLMELSGIIRQFRPTIVLTHWGHDRLNQDHEQVSAAVVRASGLTGTYSEQWTPAPRPKVFFFEPDLVGAPVNGFEPDVLIDITDVFDQKIEAVQVYKTQEGLLSRWRPNAIARAGHARSLCGLAKCEYAEAYRRLTPWGGTHFV